MMVKVIGILCVAAIIFWADAPVLWKQSKPRDIAVFIILLLMAVVLSLVMVIMNMTLTPLYFISWLLKPLSNLVRLLQ